MFDEKVSILRGKDLKLTQPMANRLKLLRITYLYSWKKLEKESQYIPPQNKLTQPMANL